MSDHIQPLQMAFRGLISAVGEARALRIVQDEMGYQRPTAIPVEKRPDVVCALVDRALSALDQEEIT